MSLLPPLAEISRTYGPRFAEFAFEPAFTAAVDQHVAEIRDRLDVSHPGLVPGPPPREELTDYALGFLDALAEMDWREPVGHDYAVCRLTAITWLVLRHDLLTDDDADQGAAALPRVDTGDDEGGRSPADDIA